MTIRGRAAWRQLWTEMGKTEAVPHINFYNYIVVGVFAGEKPTAGYDVTLMPAREEGEEIIIPVRINSPGAGGVAAQTLTYPYQLLVITRPAKSVRFSKKAAATNG